MKREDAEEYTQSLGQIVAGSYRQILLAKKLGVPKSLGLEIEEWVNNRLGGYVRMSVEDRQKAVVELHAEGESNRSIAGALGVDPKTVRNDLAGENSPSSTDAPQEDHQEGGENSPPSPAEKAARTRTAHEDIAKFAFDRPAVDVPVGDPVRLGDFYELSCELKDNTVDLIFTDPPYDDKSVPLFGRMGEVAARVLKPGGSFVTYLGHMQLFKAGELLLKHLRYWHPLCCLHSGPTARMTEYGVIETFKPMLWFVKGTRSDKQTFIESSVSGGREKDHHKWQQSESEAAYFLERLAPAGGLVVDFFAGGGTTIVTAERLGLHAIGYEINRKHQIKANDRVLSARKTK